jgi:hypothetical protein
MTAIDTIKALDLMSRKEPPVALCRNDAQPLVSTMLWPRAEWLCLACGGHYGWLDPLKGEPTPELVALSEQRRDEWKSLSLGAFPRSPFGMRDCADCHGDMNHEAHASDEDRTASEAAWSRINARIGATA